MLKYPSVSQVKAHAKYISRTLNIKLSFAKEAVAFMYGSNDFKALCSKSDLAILDGNNKFSAIPYKQDLETLKRLLQPHLPAIRAHLNPNIHLDCSVLALVVNNRLNCISHDAVNHLLSLGGSFDWSDAKSIINELEFVDSTVSTVLASRIAMNRVKNKVNPWIEFSSFGIRAYGYYNFSGKTVCIEMRELDIMFNDPSRYRDISSCKWIGDYVIGFLGVLAKQFETLGYTGEIQLSNVNFPINFANEMNILRKEMRSADPICGMRSLECYCVKPAKRVVKVSLDILINQNDPQNIWLRGNLVNEIG
ncbi:hypothetical protein ACP43V_08160 [Vibrio genomosp. F10 str. 9ZC157]|uniref:hypothetical protein n=1 Tax=Vibrio genomosp. F10 TaxID=723171 RepID=UPI0003749CDB|nr:hypothetical protein [Vibrio genomosp. F10]OEE96019.1 hypothetical protein A1QM_17500 [Vibrio genomosp. F10 str. 9ZC157]